MAVAGKKFKFNVFDIIVIIAVICIAAAGYKFMNRGKDTVSSTKTIRYTIELTEKPVGFSALVKEGDSLTDNIKNYNMGKVVSVSTEPFTDIVEDYENGKYAEGVTEELENVIIVVEANVTESESAFRVDGNYVVRAGKEIAVKGRGYAGTGFIISVER